MTAPGQYPSDQYPPAQIFLRPLASPVALGFAALAMTTFILAGLDIGWIDQPERHTTGIIMLATGPLLFFLTSVIGFLARDAVVATGMGILCAGWSAIAISMITGAPGSVSDALGTLILMGAATLLVVVFTAMQSKAVAAVVMGTTAVRWALTGIYELSGVRGWQIAAGAVGILLAGLALYAALSYEMEDVKRRAVLPTGRRHVAEDAMEGRIHTERLPTEAGVREQL